MERSRFTQGLFCTVAVLVILALIGCGGGTSTDGGITPTFDGAHGDFDADVRPDASAPKPAVMLADVEGALLDIAADDAAAYGAFIDYATDMHWIWSVLIAG